MSRYVNSVPQILDGNGNPLVGAKKVFYAPSTTTLKTIYSDSGLSTPRTNPVTSDADGRFPEIFLDGLYAEIQQDATGTADTDDGAVIWERDPVGNIDTGQFDDWVNDNFYSFSDIVRGSDGAHYKSLIAGTETNQGNDPISSPTKWALFDDTGTWTPALEGSLTAGTGWAYSQQSGNYSVIGNLAYFSGIIAPSTIGASAAGDLIITGIPIAIKSAVALAVGSVFYDSITLSAGYTQVVLSQASAASLDLVQIGSTKTSATINITAISTSTSISFSGVFEVS